MGNWVRGVALALIACGALEIALGLLVVLVGAGSARAPERSFLGFGLLALILFAGAALKIAAGVRNRRFQSRGLGIAALVTGVLTPCLPIGLVLGAIGLAVYLGSEGRRVFEWGAAGCSPDEVRRALTSWRPKQAKSDGGLLVLVIVAAGVAAVAALGIGSSVAIYGVQKYIRNAKGAEGYAESARLARGIASCAAVRGSLPPSSPAVPVELRRGKYQSVPEEWSHEAFACAHFSFETPQYFQYRWRRTSETSGEVIAVADLDADGDAELRLGVRVSCEPSGGGLACQSESVVRELARGDGENTARGPERGARVSD